MIGENIFGQKYFHLHLRRTGRPKVTSMMIYDDDDDDANFDDCDGFDDDYCDVIVLKMTTKLRTVTRDERMATREGNRWLVCSILNNQCL